MKRLFDIVFASLGLLVLSPLLIFLAYRIRQDLGSPVIFIQQRAGIHGKPFQMYKFRTMRNSLGPDGEFLPDSQRLTPLGIKLRATSLDELPELWNVLKGEMSLVGPRPLLLEYLPFYTPEQMRRHDVRPGITGWAQVNGRNLISWEEKFKLDVWYVDQRTFWLDLRVISLTFRKVITRHGITNDKGEVMPKFQASSDNSPNNKE